MSFFVNASQEEAFRLMTDFCKGRRMKIVNSNLPSYIKAECGSWVAMYLGNSKGEVEINTVKSGDGSFINLNFDFTKSYVAYLVGATVAAVFIYLFMNWLAMVNPMGRAFTLSDAHFLGLAFSVLCFILIMGFSGYDVSLSRRKFIEEFNMFIQSLTFKKG